MSENSINHESKRPNKAADIFRWIAFVPCALGAAYIAFIVMSTLFRFSLGYILGSTFVHGALKEFRSDNPPPFPAVDINGWTSIFWFSWSAQDFFLKVVIVISYSITISSVMGIVASNVGLRVAPLKNKNYEGTLHIILLTIFVLFILLIPMTLFILRAQDISSYGFLWKLGIHMLEAVFFTLGMIIGRKEKII